MKKKCKKPNQYLICLLLLFINFRGTLRITKSSQLDSVDPKAKKAAMLYNPNEDFDFGLVHLKVDFAESYACHKDGSVDIEGVKKWLAK